MTFEEVLEQSKNRKNLTNKELLEYLDFLTKEHEKVKGSILSLTYQFDKIEETYNHLLNEFDTRKI